MLITVSISSPPSSLPYTYLLVRSLENLKRNLNYLCAKYISTQSFGSGSIRRTPHRQPDFQLLQYNAWPVRSRPRILLAIQLFLAHPEDLTGSNVVFRPHAVRQHHFM